MLKPYRAVYLPGDPILSHNFPVQFKVFVECRRDCSSKCNHSLFAYLSNEVSTWKMAHASALQAYVRALHAKWTHATWTRFTVTVPLYNLLLLYGRIKMAASFTPPLAAGHRSSQDDDAFIAWLYLVIVCQLPSLTSSAFAPNSDVILPIDLGIRRHDSKLLIMTVIRTK